MVLGRSVPEILDEIGHDGSEILFPELPEPVRRRGFSVQEFMDVADKFGYLLPEVLAIPESSAGEHVLKVETFPYGRDPDSRIDHYMKKYPKGMIVGCYSMGQYHAVAYERGFIFDPSPSKGQYIFNDNPDPIHVYAYHPLILNPVGAISEYLDQTESNH